ncbi:unnamed protein product [Lactuca virosa]|uniref:GCF C-terminal domain-containing protein n=1 Tax=Lactuca virosa TaxID=75947 RepID=A0AAU9NGB6_9ASTR|nr:unnamed protein product [Lactuca virosa]
MHKEPIEEIKVFPQKEKTWLKQGVLKKKEKEYITAEELLIKKQEQGLDVVEKVFDRRGPQVRVMTSLENLNAEEKQEEEKSSPIQHNIRLIVAWAKLDMKKIMWDLRKERETIVTLQKEKEKLKDDATRQKKQLGSMEEMVYVVERLTKESLLGTLTLESVSMSFEDLQRQYLDEYKLFGLAIIASSFALPLLSRVFQGWDPLQNPLHGLNVMSVWKDLLKGNEISYTQLFMEAVFPAVRISATNTMQARDPQPLLCFLDSWEQLVPHSALQTILDNIVMPKLASAVDSWDPRRETIPIHSWVHPWLPLLGQKLQTLHHTIRNRLENVLHSWHPIDMSAYYILSPWKTVFDPTSWKQTMVRYIIPKLLAVMHEFQVNPADQKLDQFYWVRTWASAIPTHHMLRIMDVCFNKWLQVLYQWLYSKPDFQQVINWYLGWKDLIPPQLLSNEHVRYWLNIGLNMMNQAAEGLEVVHPGFRENIKTHSEPQAAKGQQPGSGGVGTVDMSLKELIGVYAQDNDLLFMPIVGRMKDGHQVFRFGNISVIIDSLNQKLFAQTEHRWSLVTLEQLVNLDKGWVLRRG